MTDAGFLNEAYGFAMQYDIPHGSISVGSAGAQITIVAVYDSWIRNYESLRLAERHATLLGLMGYATLEGPRGGGLGMVYSLQLPQDYPLDDLASAGFRCHSIRRIIRA